MLQEIKKEFFAHRNGVVADTLRRAGDPHSMIMGCQFADVVAITNYILGRQSGSFSFEAADLNGDGKVDISDVVKAMKLVMTAQ